MVLSYIVTLYITVHSTVPCNLYFFNEGNAVEDSHVHGFYHYYTSIFNDESLYTIKVDVYDFCNAYSFVLTSLNGQDGMATVYLKGDAWDNLTEEEIQELNPEERERYWFYGKVTNAYIPCPQVFSDNNTTYNIFTAQSRTDMRLLTISNGHISNYNNNYNGTGTHNWGTEARIKFHSTNIPNGIIAYSLNQVDSMNTNLFVGCKSYSLNNTFPLLSIDDSFLSDSICSYYNCVSWAIGTWWLPWPIPSIIGVTIIDDIGGLFEKYGLTTDGATENNAIVDCWVYDGEATHLSIKGNSNGLAHSFDWESKIGARERIMHPRYALTTNIPTNNLLYPYGEVEYHFIANEDYLNNRYIRWNTSFVPEEMEMINSMANSISKQEKEVFEKLYDSVQYIVSKYYIENLNFLKKKTSYIELIELCQNNSNLLGLVYQKLSKGDYLPMQIIGDLTIHTNYNLIQDIRNFSNNIKNSGKDIDVLPTILSLEMLYVKGLLYIFNNKNYERIFSNGTTLSNDEKIFQIRSENEKIIISFNLNEQSIISLGIKNISQTYGKVIFRQKTFEQGNYQYEIKTNGSGIYVFDFIINNQIYSQKIHL